MGRASAACSFLLLSSSLARAFLSLGSGSSSARYPSSTEVFEAIDSGKVARMVCAAAANDTAQQVTKAIEVKTRRINRIIKNPGQELSRSDFDYLRGTYGSVPRQNPPSGSSAREEAFRQPAPPAQVPGAPSSTPRRSTALTVQGLPLLKPPYGRITAIDLSKGDIAWQIAHGETPDAIKNHPALKGLKIPRTGQPGYQIGTLVTNGFTYDYKLNVPANQPAGTYTGGVITLTASN